MPLPPARWMSAGRLQAASRAGSAPTARDHRGPAGSPEGPIPTEDAACLVGDDLLEAGPAGPKRTCCNHRGDRRDDEGGHGDDGAGGRPGFGAPGNLGSASVDIDASEDGTWQAQQITELSYGGSAGPVDRGEQLEHLVSVVADAIHHEIPVTLGIEAPCFVPVRRDETSLLRGRCGRETGHSRPGRCARPRPGARRGALSARPAECLGCDGDRQSGGLAGSLFDLAVGSDRLA